MKKKILQIQYLRLCNPSELYFWKEKVLIAFFQQNLYLLKSFKHEKRERKYLIIFEILYKRFFYFRCDDF